MTYALTDLITPTTMEEELASLLDIAASLGLATTSWQSGSPMRTFLTAIAQKFSDKSEVNTEITKGGFGDLLSSDAWADAWALSGYDEERVPADAATGYINAANTEIANYSLGIGELIVAHSVTGKTYRNTAAITILGTTGLDDIAVQADETGTDSNAAPGTVTELVNSLVGVTVTNPESILGTDAETTAALVARCRTKWGALSPNGPKDAYDYVAKTPEFSDTETPITRTNTTASATTGVVTTYLATAAGAPTGGDVTIVQEAFDEWAEPWGVTAVAAAASEVTVPITYEVWVSNPTASSEEIETAIADALATWFAELPVGGYVIAPDTGAIYVDAIQQVIGTAIAGIVRVQVSVPAGTTAIDPDEVAVLGTITATVTLI